MRFMKGNEEFTLVLRQEQTAECDTKKEESGKTFSRIVGTIILFSERVRIRSLNSMNNEYSMELNYCQCIIFVGFIQF
jgi:hypothetical protein